MKWGQNNRPLSLVQIKGFLFGEPNTSEEVHRSRESELSRGKNGVEFGRGFADKTYLIIWRKITYRNGGELTVLLKKFLLLPLQILFSTLNNILKIS